MKKNTNVRYLVQLSLLAAIELVMAYTPLGYFRTVGLEISFLMIPVTLGAILLGPTAGAVLGGIFGLTSFGACFAPGFGATLLSIQPVLTFLVCFATRVLAGWLVGLLFRSLHTVARRKKEKPVLPFAAASLAGPLLNTLFFMSGLVICFYNTEYVQSVAAGLGAANPLMFVALFVGVQGVIEAVVGFAVCTAVSRPLYNYLHK